MADRGDGCVEYHARTTVAHYRADLFALFGLVAVDGAVRAEILGLFDGTVVDAGQSVVEQEAAFGAEVVLLAFCTVFKAMVAATRETYHRAHDGYLVLGLFLVVALFAHGCHP